MLRSLIVLVLLGICTLFLYQNGHEKDIHAPQGMIVLDQSRLQDLKKALPSPIFEKDILPFYQNSKDGALTPDQAGELVKRLRTLGKAFGDAASKATERVIASIDPESTSSDSSLKKWMDDGLAGAKERMPGWKSVAEDMLNGLSKVIATLFESAADLLQGP